MPFLLDQCSIFGFVSGAIELYKEVDNGIMLEQEIDLKPS